MRPKRYLRDEYKQLGHVCHPNRQVLGEIFSWMGQIRSTDRYLVVSIARELRPITTRRASEESAIAPSVVTAGAVLALKYWEPPSAGAGAHRPYPIPWRVGPLQARKHLLPQSAAPLPF
jgi:hypothetical protein